ncbi:MAG: M12 family metallopeptidase [Chitinophagaceae bacterium]|jgi:hypothetical protein|nr:M12 family metallopeptidase [Chitinophagaceae bacterium]
MKKLSLNGFILILFAILQLTACNKTNEGLGTNSEQKKQSCKSCEAEEALPDILGKEVVFNYRGQEISVMQKKDKFILGGDILLSPQQISILKGEVQAIERTAVNSITKLWPNRIVYYTIDPSLPDQFRVIDAIAHWQGITNLAFVQRTNQTNYIFFTTGSGCSSFVGMIGGAQNITLASGCLTGNTIHEISHAIGFYHEHVRSDRDNYVTVNYNNIESSAVNNFKKYTELGQGGLQLTGGLDYNSVMMYGSFFFSSNGLPTIVNRDGTTFNVQRVGLSNGDIDTYNYLYNRPYLELYKANIVNVDTDTQFGQRWDVYVRAFTDASKTTPMNLVRDLEVHYATITNGVSSNGVATFLQGTNNFKLGKGYSIRNLTGTRVTNTQGFVLTDLIQ